MTLVDIGLSVAVFILLLALITVKRRRGVRENLLRHNLKIKDRLIVGCHQQVDGLLTEIVELKGYTATDRVMLEQLLKQNEQYSKRNVSLRSVLAMYRSSASAVAGSVATLFENMPDVLSIRQLKPYTEHLRNTVSLLTDIDVSDAEIGDMMAQILKLLPCYVYSEGVEFMPVLQKNGDNELRLFYRIHSVEGDSPHAVYSGLCWDNPFHDRNCEGFLWLYENITTEYQLECAIVDCAVFLEQNKLLPDGTK
jgi:hypothetical protein